MVMLDIRKIPLKMKIENLNLGTFNLLVGENCSGKTTVLNTLSTSSKLDFARGYQQETIDSLSGFLSRKAAIDIHEIIGRMDLISTRRKPNGLFSFNGGSFNKVYSLLLFLYRRMALEIYKGDLVLVDNLGDGLDYRRSKILGEILLEKIKDSNIQFVGATNNSFLMDAIDIKYWNILKRKGDKITAYNYENSKQIFDDFGFTGLSNFDLLSSDYLAGKI